MSSLPVNPWSKAFAPGGSTSLRPEGVLARYAESLPQRRAEANRQASVMSQPDSERWQPEYEKEPALEAPMVSPDDLLGTGIPTKLAMLAKAGLGKGALAALGAGVIKNKGGNWLEGSVEGALRGLKRGVTESPPGVNHRGWEEARRGTPLGKEFLTELQTTNPKAYSRFIGDPPTQSVNNWIDRQLTKYIKNEMATPEDPIRALAERGITHDPSIREIWGTNAPAFVKEVRMESGFPKEGMHTSPLAGTWENVSDSMLRKSYHPNLYKPGEEMAVLSPKDNSISNNLGFNHLIDELSNAINPESGLPRHLQLDPKSLERVSVPQAVERVHGINLWRAAMKAEADQAKANNAATVLHKEYPENNPKGLKWVELKKSEALPEGWSTYDDPITGHTLPVTPEGRTITGNEADPRYAALRDALKYEGDTMGHCVGGYCDDVASGRSRIYSLRDAKGQPHVTIETEPPKLQNLNRVKLASAVGEDKADEIYSAFISSGANDLDEFVKELGEVGVPRIVQIKGKQNRAPNPEYLPMVQDFVKSGKWSEVGDLGNAGLIRHTGKRAEALGPYSTDEELTRYLDQFPEQNFAQGGSVSPNKINSVADLRAIIAAIQSGN